MEEYTLTGYLGMTPEYLLRVCGAFYECPRRILPDGSIEWLGPLAGYTSTDEKGCNRVGPEYVNFRCVQENPNALKAVAVRLANLIDARYSESLAQGFSKRAVCGIPTGGAGIVQAMPDGIGRRIWAEKHEVGEGTGLTRAPDEIWLPRDHTPKKGEDIVLVEDVGNTFSTTSKLVTLIRGYGAQVVMIALGFNRSTPLRRSFQYNGVQIPVIALGARSMPIYDIDDPMVREAIAAGNFFLDPKEHWGKVQSVMKRSSV